MRANSKGRSGTPRADQVDPTDQGEGDHEEREVGG
jgi:hypothetical protein